jgi:hypothetical protein
MAKLIMATRAPETIGFHAILNEMLRRAHYTFQPEYEVYARGYGVRLVDYMETLHLEARMVVGAVKYDFRACGTSVEMVIQEVACEAITRLHHEHHELWEAPFTYLLVRVPEAPIAHVVLPPVEPYTLEKCMADTISAYEMAHRSLVWELEETRSRLVHLQYQLEPYLQSMRLPKKIMDDWPQNTPQEEAPPSHRFPHVVGAWAEASETYNPISMGLHVRRFHVKPVTRVNLLGFPELIDP